MMPCMKRIALVAAVILFASACSDADNSPQKKFGADSYYFRALQAADSGDESEAERLFKTARRKSSLLAAKRSAQALVSIGTVKKRVEAATCLARDFGKTDAESLLVACTELFQNGEYAEVIKYTDGIRLDSEKNELVKLRMDSLVQKKDSRFEGEFYVWFVSRPLSPEHIQSYQKYLLFESEKNRAIQSAMEKMRRSRIQNPFGVQEEQSKSGALQDETEELQRGEQHNLDEAEPESDADAIFNQLQAAENPWKRIFDFRIDIYRRNYRGAFGEVDSVLAVYKNFGEEVEPQILSDIGKAALYGTDDYIAAARKLDGLSKKLSRDNSFFAFFYAARLYDKAGRFQSLAAARFRSALDVANDGMRFDNALWYLLNFQLRTSTNDIIATLKKFGARIHSPEYFDDFFESLSVLLLSNHKWQDFYRVWKETNSNFSEYTAGKYAYISGRLIEEGLAEGDSRLKTRQAVDAFTSVLSGGSSMYYKVCAMERLNITERRLVESYLLKNGDSERSEEKTVSSDAGAFLAGYASFGFPQRIYREWLANKEQLSAEDAAAASAFLNKCASLNPEERVFNVQSLRIASNAFSETNGMRQRELLELSHPRFYRTYIESVCAEYELPEYLVYALVRSESFFDSNAFSSAGASGLTQLMEATAADEARKLKLESYDIFDPETNLALGTHYLASLIKRTDGNNILLALYAYNAGLTNVRNWVRRFKSDWAETGNPSYKPAGISMDLFLESLPFAETREYGRKVIAAAAVYGFLYENVLPGEIVRSIMY